jgi:TonB family protein
VKPLREKRRSGRRIILISAGSVLSGLILIGILVFFLSGQHWWKRFTSEGMRILGRGGEAMTDEERRIREKIILKKMEEASLNQDWKKLTPEYPRPNRPGSLEGEDRLKALRESSDIKEIDKELKDYLKKKEDSLLDVEPPIPAFRDPTDFTRLKDRGAEEAINRLLSSKEKEPAEKPLEENIQLGIKGPLVSRKIIERPSPPSVRIRVEAEIELTFWVLPNGTVDRATPSVKGDAELERIAVQYLKQWRFAPLPGDQSQVEQWGTIPIRFRLD